MTDRDTSAWRKMFQYLSLVKKALDQYEIATQIISSKGALTLPTIYDHPTQSHPIHKEEVWLIRCYIHPGMILFFKKTLGVHANEKIKHIFKNVWKKWHSKGGRLRCLMENVLNCFHFLCDSLTPLSVWSHFSQFYSQTQDPYCYH